MKDQREASEQAGDAVDPTEVLRAMLKIGPEDAETMREKAGEAMEREDRKRVTEAGE